MHTKKISKISFWKKINLPKGRGIDPPDPPHTYATEVNIMQIKVIIDVETMHERKKHRTRCAYIPIPLPLTGPS